MPFQGYSFSIVDQFYDYGYSYAMTTVYTEQQKAEALAALIENGGNVKATARQLGINRITLTTWRDKAHSPAVLDTISTVLKDERIDLWDKAQQLGAKRIMELYPQSDDLRAVAYAASVAFNAYLDLTLGRKGTDQQQSLTINGPVQFVFEKPVFEAI